MRFFTLLVAVGLIVSTVASAKSKRDRDQDEKDDEGWEYVEDVKSKADDGSSDGPVQLKVPQTWAGKGYDLRVGSDLVPLDKEVVTLPRRDRRERIDLVDSTGRIVRSESTYIDENMFDYFDDPRQYHIGLFAGGANSNGKAFRKLFQNNHVQEYSLDFLWQPTSIGLLATLAGQSNKLDHDFGVDSTFTSNQSRLAATFEFAPFRSGASQRIHFLTSAGVIFARNVIKIEDEEITLQDTSSNTGGIIGIDTMYPLNDFWLTIRTYLSYQRIKFEDFDFDTQSVQRGLLFGGYYAF